MKLNQILIASFLLVLCIGLVSSANAVTLNTPAETGTLSGASYILNATVDSNSLMLSSANFFYDDGSTNTSIGTTVNDSLIEFNFTWDTTTINDVDGLVIWVNVTNATGIEISMDASTGVVLDNGNPTATLASTMFEDGLHLVSSTNFTVAIDADSTIGISSCNVYYSNSNTNELTTQAVSAGANACTVSTTPSAQSLAINQAYTVKMEATDGNGNVTNSSARTFTVTPVAGGGGGGNGDTSTEDDADDESQEDSAPSEKVNFFQAIINAIRDFFKNLFS